jgi:hypothetical protein
LNRKSIIFTQITQLLSQNSFRGGRCIVNRYSGDKYSKRLDCWQQLMIHINRMKLYQLLYIHEQILLQAVRLMYTG